MSSRICRTFSAIILTIAALMLVSCTEKDARAPVTMQPIIDMHMHADIDGNRFPAGTLPGCIPQPCSSIVTEGALVGDAALKGTIEAMDRHRVVKGFLSGDNPDTLNKWVSQGGGRFIGSPQVWTPGKPDIETLRKEYAAGRLTGMGEIATQYTGHRPDDPALDPYFALAEELDLPTLIHTLGVGAALPGFRSAAGNPLFLEEVLIKHPKLRIYVEDAGYPYLSEIVAMMSQYPQLYADLSTISWIIPRAEFHEYLHSLMRAGLGKRLMFGSDQMQWPETIGVAVDAIKTASFLTEEQKRDIFYNNAARFLRLAPEEIAKHHGK